MRILEQFVWNSSFRDWLLLSRSRLAKVLLFAYRWVDSVLDAERILSLPNYAGFLRDWLAYARLPGAEPIRLLDTYPCLQDRTKTTPFDRHYFYQDSWAFRRIHQSRVPAHVDVGSRIDFVGLLSAVTHVTFIDIRPLEARLEGLECRKGTILALPYPDDSVPSLSCLHVAEHIGLGRYGDPLDPCGTEKAARELARVLAPGGHLYFSLPIGKPRLCFNAHRIHSPQQILDYFAELELVEFSAIDDQRMFRQNVSFSTVENSVYACGLFWFKKPNSPMRS